MKNEGLFKLHVKAWKSQNSKREKFKVLKDTLNLL